MLLLTFAIALLLGVAIELNRRLNNHFLNPYRVQSTGDILIEYMDEYNHWPTDWNELHRFVESNGNNLYGVRTFRELQDNVTIDFAFDPESAEIPIYGSENDRSLRVVVATDGTYHGATHDPNVTIYRYVERKRRHDK
jgi:hypothetical protein